MVLVRKRLSREEDVRGRQAVFAPDAQDVLGARPRLAQELRKQSTLPGNHWPARDKDVELPQSTLLELNWDPQSVADEGSETRCLCGDRRSGLAVDDADVH